MGSSPKHALQQQSRHIIKSVRFAPLPPRHYSRRPVLSQVQPPDSSPRQHMASTSRSKKLTTSPSRPSPSSSLQTRLRQHLPYIGGSQQNDDIQGDHPTEQTSIGTFRVYYSNIHGIPSNNISQECHSIGFHAATYHFDYIGLVETNINWNNSMIKMQITNIMKKYWKQTLIQTTSIPTNTTNIYQPGGTMAILGNNWTGGATTTSDPSGFGRWTTITIQGRSNRQFHLITAYRPPNNTITSAGINTSYYHQWHALRRQGVTSPDPREQLLNDLTKHLQELNIEETAVLLMMDANESMTDKNSKVHKWIQQHQLIDVHLHLHLSLIHI